MKQETKQRLKYYSKIGQYIVVSLCWLIALIGVTAYSVYWLRQNANYEPEVQTRVLAPKSAIDNSVKRYVKTRDSSYFSDYLYEHQNNHSYQNYFTFYVGDQDYGERVRYEFIGDIYAYSFGQNQTYKRVIFDFDFQKNYDSLGLVNCSLYPYLDNSNDVYQVFYRNLNTGNFIFRPISFTYQDLHNTSVPTYINEVQENGVFNFYFEELFNTLDTSTIHINSGINNATNFLLTYNRMNYSMGVYQVNYNLQIGYKLVIPLDFVSNNEVFDAIIIYPQYCYSYINNNGQKVDNYGQGYTIDQMPFITSFIGYQYKGQTMTATKTPNDTLGGVTNSYETYNSFNGGVIAGSMLLAGYIQVEHSTTNVTNYPVFDLRQGMQMNELYSDVTFKTSILNSKVPNNWWSVNGGGTAPFTLPLDYITYSDFFTYFNYNGPVDYVINVTTDIGLQNVFVLIKDAFGGLTGLLAIQVLPGLTLGLLVFMPFLVGLIIVIIRLVKK